MRRIFLALSVLLIAGGFANSQVFSILKDINPGSPGSSPTYFTGIDGKVIFRASDGVNGTELWRTDGTAGGTVLLKDINPGSASSSPSHFININGTVYFRANNGVNGIELWKTDGTTAGTVMVKDIYPGATSSSPQHLTNLNGTLVFTANTFLRGNELWKSNGTSAGTLMVKDIYTGISGSNPSWFTQLGSDLYFAAKDAAHGTELWKTNGTSGGTVLVKDIFPGTDGVTGLPNASNPISLLNVNNTLFFTAFDNINGWDLYKSNGTAASTVNVDPAASISMPTWLTGMNGVLYFVSLDDELWKSDGTVAGTELVKVINPGAGSGLPHDLAVHNNLLYFGGRNALGVDQLWISDGTTAGTVAIKDVDSRYFKSIGNLVYFSGDDGVNGREIWKSDGTTSGTVRVQEIHPTGNASPTEFVEVNSRILTAVTDNAMGREIWIANDPSASTYPFSLVKDIIPGPTSGFPDRLNNTNGSLLFNAPGGLWISDGTAAGTVLHKVINPGGNAFPDYFTPVGTTTFFTADDGAVGKELWKTDGTVAGTVLVKDINAGSAWSDPMNLVNVNGTLFFRAFSAGNGRELWKSDGTTAGTVMVKDINPGTGSSNGPVDILPTFAAALNSLLIFRATNGVNGYEVWKSDGTATGTTMLRDIVAGSGSSNPHSFVTINGITFFTANNQLWKTDGTVAGTTMLMGGPVPGTSNTEVRMLEVNGQLFFAANNQLWKSDGTAGGTVLVEAVNNPRHFANLNGLLVFIGGDGVAPGLWRSDGTAAGTYRIRANLTIPGMSIAITNIGAVVGSEYWFRADDGVNGVEIWQTDGSMFGTSKLQEIMPGISSSNATGFVIAGNKIYISVESPDYGIELWAANMPRRIIPLFTLSPLEGILARIDGLLNWKASNLDGVSIFEVQRSLNGKDFERIGEVGVNEKDDAAFRYLDRDIISLDVPVVYYRLRINDKDGKQVYSNIVAIKINKPLFVNAKLFPNPVGEQVSILTERANAGNLSISIIDLNGRRIQQRMVNAVKGSNSFSLNVAGLKPGVYTVVVDDGREKISLRMVKQ